MHLCIGCFQQEFCLIMPAFGDGLCGIIDGIDRNGQKKGNRFVFIPGWRTGYLDQTVMARGIRTPDSREGDVITSQTTGGMHRPN
jgi:hypothetical protein